MNPDMGRALEKPTKESADAWRFFSAPTSPFVRKVRIVLREKGLAHRVAETPCDPFQEEPAFTAVNPVAQVPALAVGDLLLSGSDVICGWLDEQGSGPRLLPAGAAYWEARARESVADGVMECGVRLRSESKRPESQRSDSWTGRWLRGIERGLDRLEATLPPDDAFDLGLIATVCAGSYLSFRHPHIGWRASRPRLAARIDALERRASFAPTHPSLPL